MKIEPDSRTSFFQQELMNRLKSSLQRNYIMMINDIVNSPDSIILPAHTRTIYVEYWIRTHKYKLNLPTLAVNKRKIVALNDKNEPCWVPLLNVGERQLICLGDEYNMAFFGDVDKNQLVKALFLTTFKVNGWKQNIKNYVGDSGNYKIHKFYQKWEKTGKLELIPIELGNCS